MKKWMKLIFVAILIINIATMQIIFAGGGDQQNILEFSRGLLEKEDKKSPDSKVIRRTFFESVHIACNPISKIQVVRVHALTEKEVKGTRKLFVDRVEYSTTNDNSPIVHCDFLPIRGYNLDEVMGYLDLIEFYLGKIRIRTKLEFKGDLQKLEIMESEQRDFTFDQLHKCLCTKKAGWFNTNLDALYYGNHHKFPKSYVYK